MRVLDSTVLIRTWSGAAAPARRSALAAWPRTQVWNSTCNSTSNLARNSTSNSARKSTSTWSASYRLAYRRTYLLIFYGKCYGGVILKIHSLEYLLHDSRSYVRNYKSNSTCSRFWHRARDRACCYTHLHEFAKVLKVVLVHWTRSHLLTEYEIRMRSSTTYS